MNRKIVLICLIIFALEAFIVFFIAKMPVKPLEAGRAIIKNNEILSNIYMEASPFVWNGRLKYFIAERDDKKKQYDLAIYDFQTKKKEVTFGQGLGLGSAAVINNTLYVTATKDWFDFGKSEVYLFTSKDLKTFSKPKLIYKAARDQKIFNTDITRDTKTGQFIISYESQDNTVPYTIYFLQSKDGNNWHSVPGAIFGKDSYVACPTIKYINNEYYLLFGMEEYSDPNCPTCRSYVTRISRSKDLKKWETSPDTFLTADQKGEGINNADVDLSEYNGQTYIFYSIGDQATWGGLKYAVYNGSEQALIKSYFN